MIHHLPLPDAVLLVPLYSFFPSTDPSTKMQTKKDS